MAKPKRSKNQAPRIVDYDDVTTITVTNEVKDKLYIIADWMDRDNYKKTEQRVGYIVNDAVKYLLSLVDINDFV